MRNQIIDLYYSVKEEKDHIKSLHRQGCSHSEDWFQNGALYGFDITIEKIYKVLMEFANEKNLPITHVLKKD